MIMCWSRSMARCGARNKNILHLELTKATFYYHKVKKEGTKDTERRQRLTLCPLCPLFSLCDKKNVALVLY